jgi:hypothetical protein
LLKVITGKRRKNGDKLEEKILYLGHTFYKRTLVFPGLKFSLQILQDEISSLKLPLFCSSLKVITTKRRKNGDILEECS